jgi:hypothetical protein
LDGVRREGRQVMRLLTQAAQRTVEPTLQDLLTLAGGLMAVLGNWHLAARAKRLNRRVARRLEAFLEKRFEKVGVVVSTKTFLERLMAGSVVGLAFQPQRPRGPRSLAQCAKPKPQVGAVGSAGVLSAQPAEGPDLPEKVEEFVSLVRRAFCAPHPEPEDEAVRELIDELAGCLWDRLHTFDVVVQCERERLDRALEEMGRTLPDEGRNHLRGRCWSIEAHLQETLGRRDDDPLLRSGSTPGAASPDAAALWS